MLRLSCACSCASSTGATPSSTRVTATRSPSLAVGSGLPSPANSAASSASPQSSDPNRAPRSRAWRTNNRTATATARMQTSLIPPPRASCPVAQRLHPPLLALLLMLPLPMMRSQSPRPNQTFQMCPVRAGGRSFATHVAALPPLRSPPLFLRHGQPAAHATLAVVDRTPPNVRPRKAGDVDSASA